MDFGLLAAFTAGLLTFFSPCVLPLIPVYLSLMIGTGLEEARRDGAGRFFLFLNSMFFAAGFIVVFTILGMSATAFGSLFLTNRTIFQQIGGLLVFTFGLKLLGYLKVDFLDIERRLHIKASGGRVLMLNSFLMGFFFAFGWTPCVGPVLGSILTYAAVSSPNFAEGGVMLCVYGAGLAVPLLLIPLFLGPLPKALEAIKRGLIVIEKAMGLILMAMGVLLVTDRIEILEPAPAAVKIHADEAFETGVKVEAAEGGLLCEPGQENGACGITDEPEIEKILRGEVKKPAFIEFYGRNCPVCLKMLPAIKAIEKSCLNKNLTVLKIDIADEENRKLAKRHGVIGVPTFLFLDKNGREVSRLIGYQKIENIENILSVITSGECGNFTVFRE